MNVTRLLFNLHKNNVFYSYAGNKFWKKYHRKKHEKKVEGKTKKKKNFYIFLHIKIDTNIVTIVDTVLIQKEKTT